MRMCLHDLYACVGVLVYVCECVWPETVPSHFAVCSGAFEPKIEKDKMKYNYPKTGWL